MSAPIIKINSERETKGFFLRVVALALLTITIIALGAWQSPKQEKAYKVELTLKGWQVMVDCLKQSNAPSSTTNTLIDEISKQIDPILIAEQKKADSINKIQKPKQ